MKIITPTSASVKNLLLVFPLLITYSCNLESGLNLKSLFKRDLCCSTGVTMTPLEDIFNFFLKFV